LLSHSSGWRDGAALAEIKSMSTPSKTFDRVAVDASAALVKPIILADEAVTTNLSVELNSLVSAAVNLLAFYDKLKSSIEVNNIRCFDETL